MLVLYSIISIICRISYGTPPSKRKHDASKLGNVKRVIAMVPWISLLACSFLIVGLGIFLVHGKKAGRKSQALLDAVNSQGRGLSDRIHLFHESYDVTAGFVGGCIVASLILALLRLKQKMRMAKGKSHSSKAFITTAFLFGVPSIVFLGICLVWFTLNAAYLSSWALGLSSLGKAMETASITIKEFGKNITSNSKYSNIISVDQKTKTCPSAACFDLRYFPWLDSENCLCNQELLSSTQKDVDDLFNAVVWSLGAMGCLHFGALLGLLHCVADLIKIRLCWKSMKENSKMASPSKLQSMKDINTTYALTPGTALRKPKIHRVTSSGGFTSPYPGWGGGYMD